MMQMHRNMQEYLQYKIHCYIYIYIYCAMVGINNKKLLLLICNLKQPVIYSNYINLQHLTTGTILSVRFFTPKRRVAEQYQRFTSLSAQHLEGELCTSSALTHYIRDQIVNKFTEYTKEIRSRFGGSFQRIKNVRCLEKSWQAYVRFPRDYTYLTLSPSVKRKTNCHIPILPS